MHPRKNNILLILLLWFVKPVYSELPFGIKGIKSGAAFSNFPTMNDIYNPGYVFGVVGEKQLSSHAALSWEALFTTRGGILTDIAILTNAMNPDEMYMYDVHCSVLFLEIPIYLKLKLPLNDTWTLFMMSGPSVSSARKDFSSLKNKRSYSGTPEDYYNELLKVDSYLNYDAGPYSSNRLDKSLRLGFNWGIGFSCHRFSIESRYSKIYQDLGYLDNLHNVNLRTHTIQVILTVQFTE